MRKILSAITVVCVLLVFLSGCVRRSGIEDTAGLSIPKEDDTNAAESDDLTTQYAEEIISALGTADKIGACALPYDENCKYYDEQGNIYYKANTDEFASVSDVHEFLYKYMTDEFISQWYLSILDTDAPVCIDVDGELYIKYAPKGGRFNFLDTEPVIEKLSDDSYWVFAEYDNYNSKEYAKIMLIKDGDKFKINDVTETPIQK